MRLSEFMQDRFRQLIVHTASIVSLSVFLRIVGISFDLLILIWIVWILGLALILITNFYKEKKHLLELESIINDLDKKYLLMECIEKPINAYERKLTELLRRSGKSMLEAVSDAENRQKEYQEYIEGWVHEIKVPITAAELICRNNKSDATRKLMIPLTQIEDHVERVLYYARAGSYEKDFVIRAVSLSGLVTETLSKHQTLLIQNKIRIETSDLDFMVYTDNKWTSFMIGQLISNAIRYKKENPVITLEAYTDGGKTLLKITDNGIGIHPSELPRIFERGFTGSNGRLKGKSTGMGLFICKKLADFLQINLEVKSSPGEYTSFQMTFPAKP